MQVPSSSVGPHNAKKNPTILTESTDHVLDQIFYDARRKSGKTIVPNIWKNLCAKYTFWNNLLANFGTVIHNGFRSGSQRSGTPEWHS